MMVGINLEKRVFTLVAGITGHQPDQLEPDMYLESELGLDSIKMLEFFNGMMQLIPEEKRGDFSVEFPVQRLMQIQTLREAIDIISDWQSVEDDANKYSSHAELPTNVFVESEQELPTVDVLHSQYLHLLSHWLVDSNSLCYNLRLHGSFDIDVAQRSWKELIARHPMLKVRFSIPENATSFKDYKLTVLENPNLPEIPVTDIRHLDTVAREKFLEDEFQKWLNYEWKLVEYPLHKFFVFRLEDSVYQLFFANEHIIADGLGCQLILREFMEIYRARTCGEEPTLPPPTTVEDYQALVEKLNSWNAPEEEKSLAEYVNRQGKDSFIWNPENSNFNAHRRPKFRNLRYVLERDMTAKLIARTRDWRLPLNSILLAAFLRAVYGMQSVMNEGNRIFPDTPTPHTP
ncbi:MAG: condensation domain-containing protein, partial [Scytonema sp. PMC 1069.18]|nr:condensation domain-containing protein [Scytonema sp. PMC 1069.18]